MGRKPFRVTSIAQKGRRGAMPATRRRFKLVHANRATSAIMFRQGTEDQKGPFRSPKPQASNEKESETFLELLSLFVIK